MSQSRGSTEYPYQPLDGSNSEFRLLKLHAGKREDAIRCSLFHASLHEADFPTYETVSYCWGGRAVRASILLDGILTDVPSSSEQALRRLRYRDEDRTIWIDAICIDQTDNAEKAQQVAMMADIYRGTRRNLICLGSDARAAEALQNVEMMLAGIRSETSNYESMLATLYDQDEAFRLSPTGVDPAVDLAVLIRLYSAPWFRRVWVVQEAALSRESLCFWGDCCFPLTDALKVAVWLAHKVNFLPPEISSAPGMLAAAEMFDYAAHDIVQMPDEPSKLLPLLVQHQDLGAHDPRDHVYGLLGLYQSGRKIRPLPALVAPDYNRPLADVLRGATKLAITEQEDLQVFLHLFHREKETVEETSFPSWVPRWHRAWDREVDASRLSYFFRAGGDRMAKIAFPSSGRLLVDGLEIDAVSKPTPVVDSSALDGVAGLTSLLKSARRLMQHNRSSDESRSDDVRLGQVLMAGRNSEGRPATEEDASALSLLSRSLQAGQMSPPLHELKRCSEAPSNCLMKAANFHQCIRRACANRRLFKTTSGRLGLGPRTMQESDVVCILFGSQWPVILRRRGESYQTVGVCYVEGVMHGDAVLLHERERRLGIAFSIV